MSRVAVVTGGAKGIGRAIVLALADDGNDIAIWDLDATATTETVKAVQARGRAAIACQTDLVDDAAVARAADATATQLGGIDTLVNNAGIMRLTPIDAPGMDDWDLVLRLNLRAPIVCTRVCLAALKRSPAGCIVNVASNVVVVARLANGAYTAAKVGLIGLTRVLALELAPYRIRVNAISPGSTKTDMMALYDEPMLDGILRGSLEKFRIGIPLGAFAAPEDHGAAVRFLASAQAKHITGQNLVIDGGQTLA